MKIVHETKEGGFGKVKKGHVTGNFDGSLRRRVRGNDHFDGRLRKYASMGQNLVTDLTSGNVQGALSLVGTDLTQVVGGQVAASPQVQQLAASGASQAAASSIGTWIVQNPLIVAGGVAGVLLLGIILAKS